MKNKSMVVQGTEIALATRREQDYISLTDMVKKFGDESILYNWLRNRNTIEFLGIWEQLYNPVFKPVEFERFKSLAGLNRLIAAIATSLTCNSNSRWRRECCSQWNGNCDKLPVQN